MSILGCLFLFPGLTCGDDLYVQSRYQCVIDSRRSRQNSSGALGFNVPNGRHYGLFRRDRTKSSKPASQSYKKAPRANKHYRISIPYSRRRIQYHETSRDLEIEIYSIMRKVYIRGHVGYDYEGCVTKALAVFGYRYVCVLPPPLRDGGMARLSLIFKINRRSHSFFVHFYYLLAPSNPLKQSKQ